MVLAFLSNPGDLLLTLLGLLCLGVILAGWLWCIVSVAKDVKVRAPDQAVFWVALTIYTGPVGLIAWRYARPS